MWPFTKQPQPPLPANASFSDRHPFFSEAFTFLCGTFLIGTAFHFIDPSVPLYGLAILGVLASTISKVAVDVFPFPQIKRIFTPKTPDLKDIADIRRGDAYGSGRFADPERDTVNFGQQESGIFFGQSKSPAYTYTRYTPLLGREKKQQIGGVCGPAVYSTPNAHTLVCAPTRSGKGAGILIPTLLRNEHSVLAIDPKGELAAITARHRRDKIKQQVIILNPWRLHHALFDGYGFDQIHSFNPLDILDPNDPNIVSNAMFLASLLVPHSGSGDPFWDTEAQKLLFGLMLYVTDKEPRNKKTPRVREILNRKQTLDDALAGMAASVNQLFGKSMGEIGDNFLNMPERQRGSIISTAQSHVKFLLDPVAAAALDTSTFLFSQLKTAPTTVYLVIPPEYLISHSRWLRLMVGSAMRAFQEPTPPKQRCLFILEEFASLGHMQAIETGVSTIAGYGVDFLFVLQDLSQLRNLYHAASDTFIANSAFRFFTNISDKSTADYVSHCLGQQTVTVQSISTSKNSGQPGQKQTSESQSLTGKPVASPDELMRYGIGPAILFQPGVFPTLLTVSHYFQIPQLNELADKNPYRQ